MVVAERCDATTSQRYWCHDQVAQQKVFPRYSVQRAIRRKRFGLKEVKVQATRFQWEDQLPQEPEHARRWQPFALRGANLGAWPESHSENEQPCLDRPPPPWPHHA